MDKLFINIFNMSITASYLIITVIAVRFLLRKSPKIMRIFLWFLVGIKLSFPFSIESEFSFVPNSQVVDESIYYESTPKVNVGIQSIDTAINQYIEYNYAPMPEYSVNKIRIIGFVLSSIWIMGIIIMLGYMIISWTRLRLKVRTAIPKNILIDKNIKVKIYQSDLIESPFLLGIIKPRIYVPFHIPQENLLYVVMHEIIHIRRKDYIIKLIGFLLLTVYWFNPFVWSAYILMCKDIELICDENVIKKMGMEYKKEYSQALLMCSVKRCMISTCPVAFGEISVKERVKNVLNYKKSVLWVSIITIAVCIIVPICFMTRKKTDIPRENTKVIIEENEELLHDITKTKLHEKNSVDDINTYIVTWATAFCNRDGNTIRDMVSDTFAIKLIENGMLFETGEGYSFGWSSPWPWGTEEVSINEQPYNYRIIDATENTAHILYYAWTSDPHVTVWKETLEYSLENDKIMIISETLDFMDGMCIAEEFYEAYPQGIIKGTNMDYYSYNGAGKALNDNAIANKNSEWYNKLFEPDTAAIYLLNMLNNTDKVGTAVDFDGDSSTCKVTFEFYEDNSRANVIMIQPYGSDGIWFPY